jgi:hypothetical protein
VACERERRRRGELGLAGHQPLVKAEATDGRRRCGIPHDGERNVGADYSVAAIASKIAASTPAGTLSPIRALGVSRAIGVASWFLSMRKFEPRRYPGGRARVARTSRARQVVVALRVGVTVATSAKSGGRVRVVRAAKRVASYGSSVRVSPCRSARALAWSAGVSTPSTLRIRCRTGGAIALRMSPAMITWSRVGSISCTSAAMWKARVV